MFHVIYCLPVLLFYCLTVLRLSRSRKVKKTRHRSKFAINVLILSIILVLLAFVDFISFWILKTSDRMS